MLEQRLVDALHDVELGTNVWVASDDHTISATVEVAHVDHVSEIEAALSSSLSVIANQWLSDRSGETPRRNLECVIPPDVKPSLWSALSTPPRTFTLSIEATLTPEHVTSANRVPFPTTEGSLALVMKGGGIKGLAYVGALEILWGHYQFDHFVGTSAGAISALLLAAGYTPTELKEILSEKDFRDFFDAPWYMKPFNLMFYGGMNPALTFTDWIDVLLAKKLNSSTRVRMSELPARATVFASRRNKPALRFDSESDDADAGHAARCSMSIPLVFVPQSDQGFRTYDGGMQHNYPIDELLRCDPGAAFISLYLGPETYQPSRNRFEFWEWVSIWTEGADAELLKRYRDRTVVIDPTPIGTLDFDLSDEEKDYLLQCGRAAALAHLEQGSDRHNTAVQMRDQMRQQVMSTRTARQRWRWSAQFALFIGALFLALAIVVYRWWL